MQAEKILTLAEEVSTILALNDYVCIDDFLTDRKVKFDKKMKQQLVEQIEHTKYSLEIYHNKMYVYDAAQIDLRFMGKRLHKIIKEIIELNQSRVQTDFASTSPLEELETTYEMNFNKNIERIVQNYYYRGQGDSNFYLMPSIFRTFSFLENEEKMYHELQIKCPDDFANCKSHLDILTTMQHYSMPTRLLDITTNLLVAIFFAVESMQERDGEIIIFDQAPEDVLYYDSDTIEIACAMAKFSYVEKRELKRLAELHTESYQKTIAPIHEKLRADLQNTRDETMRQTLKIIAEQEIHQAHLDCMATFNQLYAVQQMLKKIGKLTNNNSLQMDPTQLINNHFVKPMQNNNRIIRQSGAFIVGGLQSHEDSIESLNHLRLRNAEGLKVKIIIPQAYKKGIEQALTIVGINESTIYPDIERVSSYLKDLYRND